MTRYPLSYQQEEHLSVIRAYPQCAPRQDHPMLMELDPELDLELLTEAIGDVVQRHSVLRTTIDCSSGVAQQWVHDRPPAPVTHHELPEGALPELTASLMAGRLGTEDVLAGRPLFRAAFHRIGARVYLSLCLPHVINDGWSDGILWRDLSEFYAARSQGREPGLAPLAMSYGQFAQWQRELWPRLREEVVPRWRETLAGYPEGRLRWPASTEEVDPESLVNGISPVKIDDEMLAGLRRLARACKVTPFVVLLAVSATAFTRVLGRNDVLLGTTTANREEPFKHEMIGHFANTRLTRVQVDPDEPVEALVARVREGWLGNNDQPEVYSECLLEELGQPGWAHVNLNPATSVAPGMAVAPRIRRSLVQIDPGRLLDRRDVGLMWTPTAGAGFSADFLHRLSRVDSDTAAAVCHEIETVLRGI